MSVLKVDNVKKSFKKGFIPQKVEVLKGISFELEEGSVVGFLGANGAGKTTTMKCIFDLVRPDSGNITFFGGQKLDKSVKSEVGFLPEHPYFYSYLSGYEFLKFYGRLSEKIPSKDLDNKILDVLEKVGLVDAKDKHLKSYSKGMLQKIGFAQAIIHQPKLVILDEPLSGLDPDGRYYLSKQIKEVAALGCTVLFSSHLLNDAERICDNLIILKNGLVEYCGTYRNLVKDFSKKFEIKYAENEKIQTLVVENPSDLQTTIDKLRAEQKDIIDIRKSNEGLENYFVKMILESER